MSANVLSTGRSQRTGYFQADPWSSPFQICMESQRVGEAKRETNKISEVTEI